MSRDIRKALLEAAPTPERDLDLGALAERGHRHRLQMLVTISVAVVSVGVAGWGAASLFEGHQSADEVRPARDVPMVGSEEISSFGGPMAASGTALFIANDIVENSAGDKSGIERFDLSTAELTHTDPSSMSTPDDVAMARTGMWMVGWQGDIGGPGAHTQGRIQLVNPDTGEVLLDLPRDDSAPYDVTVAEENGRELGWVADASRDQLLSIDPRSGTVVAFDLGMRPSAVASGDGAVWIGGQVGREDRALARYDTSDGSLETFPVDHCVGDLVVSEGSLWVTDCDGAVHEYDAASGQPLATVMVEGHPSAITVADGLVWVLSDSAVRRIDPEGSREVGDPIWIDTDAGGAFWSYLATGGDTVFVSMVDGVHRLGEGLPVQESPPPVKPDPEEAADPRESDTCSLDDVMCIPLDREWSVAGAGFGSGWVGNVGEGKTFGIARFDAETGEEVGRLSTDGFVVGFAADDRWMWALVEAGDELSALKIDPSTTQVEDELDLGNSGNIGGSSIAAGSGRVFVSLPGGSVTRIWSADGKMETWSYADDLPGYGAGSGPLKLAYGDDHLWLSYGRGHLAMVDPASGTPVRLDEDVLGANAYDIIVAGSAVWSPHQSPYGDNEISYTEMSGPDGDLDRVLLLDDAAPGMAATDGESIWVLQWGFGDDATGWLVQVDATTHEMAGEPLEVDLEFRGGVAAGDGYVWVTGNKVLYRVTSQD